MPATTAPPVATEGALRAAPEARISAADLGGYGPRRMTRANARRGGPTAGMPGIQAVRPEDIGKIARSAYQLKELK